MKNFFIKLGLAFVLASALSWTYSVMPEAFFSFDNRLRDFMFIIRGELPKSDRVTIVDIDEKALHQFGQWPWSRDVVAKLLYKLTDAGAGIIGLDMVFAEKDMKSPSEFAKKFPNIKGNFEDYDAELAHCFETTPVVGGYIFTFEKTKENNPPIIPAVFIQKGLYKEDALLRAKGMVLNIDILQNALYSSGFFNNIPDEGGMIRRVPLIMEYDGIPYPSLAFELVRLSLGASKVKIVGDGVGVENVSVGGITIPTDKAGRLVVNFRGPKKHFKYISTADILNSNFDKKDIEGKIVLIGTSALGLFDLRGIPYDNAIAGVEVHANIVDNILSGDFISKPSEIATYDILTIFAIVLFVLFLFAVVKSWFIIPTAVVVLYLLFEFFFYMLFKQGMALNLLFPFLAYILTLILSVGYDYVVTSRQKEEAKRMLGKKVSPAVMNYLLEHSTEKIVRSKELEATIFFSDIRSFTTISEKIGSPDKVIHMLNRYLTPMVENIVKHEGTIDKFIGDAIMAYWNAPIAVKNHPDQAVKSAIEQIEMLDMINKDVTPEYDVTIKIGIGIHTGIVTAGDMGSEGRSDYTIIGDNVNLASRMEGLTKQYAAQILISSQTYERLKGEYTIRPIDLVAVKGKSEAVEIFEVLCKSNIVPDDELGLYNEALEEFRSGKVVEANQKFHELQEKNPAKLYEQYILRCEYFIANEDIEFSPVLRMVTK